MKSPAPILFASALLLSGCGGVSAAPATSAPTGNNQPAASSAASTETSAAPAATTAAAAATSAAAAADDGTASFGTAYTWEDGLAITVSKPTKFKPGEYAAGTEKAKNFVAFEVRVVNKTGKVWDPSLLHASVQSNNEEADQVFDSEKLKDMPQTKLLNGREAKVTVAFGVANPKDIVMEVTPDFEHEAVLFKG